MPNIPYIVSKLYSYAIYGMCEKVVNKVQEIIVYDANGNSMINLVQWDKDVNVYIRNTDIDAAYDVHFFNDKQEEALVVNSTYTVGVLKAKIPNVLLTEPYAITGYINVVKNGENKSLYGFRLGVRKKPKPSDYVFVDTDDYVTLESIRDECRDFAKAASNSSKESENFAKQSKSYAVGGTSTRQNEEQDNSKYYSEQAKKQSDSAASSAKTAEKHNAAANESAGAASGSAADAADSANKAKGYADQVASDKQEIDETIKNSLLASSEEILAAMEDYFKRAEELYRSCTIVCDGETPTRRACTIIEIDCHTPERRATGYYGIDFDGQTPAIRLLGE